MKIIHWVLTSLSEKGSRKRCFQLPFEISCQGQELTMEDGSFTATSDNVKTVLAFKEEAKASEVYLGLEGVSYTPVPAYDLYFGSDAADPLRIYNRTNFRMKSGADRIRIRREKLFRDPVQDVDLTVTSSTGVSKTLSCKHPNSSFSSGRDDFIVNMGYSEEPVTSVTITFPGRGIYHFDSIRVYRIPMDGYAEKIGRLREDTLENIEFGTDCLEGDISSDQKKILCIATPYSKGWRAFLDGKEKPVLCLNRHYPGLVLEPGRHHIRFEYSRPYGRAGLVLTLAGILALALIAAVTERKRRSAEA